MCLIAWSHTLPNSRLYVQSSIYSPVAQGRRQTYPINHHCGIPPSVSDGTASRWVGLGVLGPVPAALGEQQGWAAPKSTQTPHLSIHGAALLLLSRCARGAAQPYVWIRSVPERVPGVSLFLAYTKRYCVPNIQSMGATWESAPICTWRLIRPCARLNLRQIRQRLA